MVQTLRYGLKRVPANIVKLRKPKYNIETEFL
jgi:hypothetical protein